LLAEGNKRLYDEARKKNTEKLADD